MNHLVIYNKSLFGYDYIAAMLRGDKKLGCKFRKNKTVPYQKLHNGDYLYLKESAGPIRGRVRAILKHCNVAGLHGAAWNPEDFGQASTDSFYKAAFPTEETTINANPHESTAALTTSGIVSAPPIGGNQDSIATGAGWTLPSFKGAILLLEAFNLRLGHIDRQLTMLEKSGQLAGIKGIALGQYTECGTDTTTQVDWAEIDVLRDRLHRLNVPILGGLPLGHGKNPIAIPIGTMATLNADAKTLTITPGVK